MAVDRGGGWSAEVREPQAGWTARRKGGLQQSTRDFRDGIAFRIRYRTVYESISIGIAKEPMPVWRFSCVRVNISGSHSTRRTACRDNQTIESYDPCKPKAAHVAIRISTAEEHHANRCWASVRRVRFGLQVNAQNGFFRCLSSRLFADQSESRASGPSRDASPGGVRYTRTDADFSRRTFLLLAHCFWRGELSANLHTSTNLTTQLVPGGGGLSQQWTFIIRSTINSDDRLSVCRTSINAFLNGESPEAVLFPVFQYSFPERSPLGLN